MMEGRSETEDEKKARIGFARREHTLVLGLEIHLVTARGKCPGR